MSACAYGRSADDLRQTLMGRMPPPPGSALAAEYYTPAAFGIDGPLCAHLERIYASNDAQAFLTALKPLLQRLPHRYVQIPPYPVFRDGDVGYSPAVSASGVNGTHVQVDFHDVDDPHYRAPAWLDARAWRYVIHVRIWDEHAGQGGGCDERILF